MPKKPTPARGDMPLRNLALRLFIESTGLTRKDFAEKCGMNNAERLNRLFTYDRHKGAKERYPVVSSDVAEMVARAFNLPNDWLDMEEEKLENELGDAAVQNELSTTTQETRPHILTPIAAGPMREDAAVSQIQMPVVKYLPPYDMTMTVDGDSMIPTYYSGDVIAVRNVTKTGFRQWGKVHVIYTSQGPVVKRLYSDEKNNSYICKSDNPDYPPYSVPADEVFGIFLVVGVIRKCG